MGCYLPLKSESALTNPFSLIPFPSSLLTFGEGMRFLTAAAAAWGVARGLAVLVVDAANRFDPYQLVREGRKRGLLPDQVLTRVQVSRVFTCHQLVQLVWEGLPAELAKVDRALVILLGPCSLFYDEQTPLAERRRLFRTMMGGLVQVKQRAALWFLQANLPPQVANQHFGRLLARLAEQVIQVGAGEGDGRRVCLPKAAAG
ncbi:hypothetical protein [Desulfobacca acetoxidans]